MGESEAGWVQRDMHKGMRMHHAEIIGLGYSRPCRIGRGGSWEREVAAFVWE